jgi:hypothetical protein
LCFVVFSIFFTFFSLQNISDEKFVYLFDALKRNTRLGVLCLANTDMLDRVASKFCDALGKNSTLRVLNVESNFITPPVFRSSSLCLPERRRRSSERSTRFVSKKQDQKSVNDLE